MARFLGYLRLPIFLAGLALFFAGERYLDTFSYYKIVKFSSLGLLWVGVLIPFLLGLDASKAGRPGEARSWRYIGAWQLSMALAPVFYLAYVKLLGSSGQPETWSAKVLLGLWLAPAVLGAFSAIGLELSLRASGRGPRAEPQRVARAGGQWLLIGVAALSLANLNYASARKNKVFDWSYLKTTKPGEATLKMVKTLDKDLEIALFYPQTNEVRPLLAEYFTSLAASEPKLKLSYYDIDLNPTKAEQYKVSKNGQVVLKIDDRQERFEVGLDLKKARASLVKLDSVFQKHFLALTAKRRVAYFTRGHDEMNWNRTDSSPLRSLSGLEQILRSQNYGVRFFGTAEGSLTKVPDDASVVVIAGPAKAFLKEEVEVLKAYLEQGGKLFVLLDVDTLAFDDNIVTSADDDPLKVLLKGLGLAFNKVHLGNDRQYVTATRSNVDRWFLYTNVFSSHESVQSLARHDERIQVLSFQSGFFDLSPKTGVWKGFETVKALSGTFNDINRNFAFDEDQEKRQSYVTGAALEQGPGEGAAVSKGGKVVALADSSMVADGLLRNPGNQLLIVDSFKWLVGDSATAGEIASEEDVKVQHSRSRDLYLFHGSIFLVPLLVLGGGYVATRRRKVQGGAS